MFTVPDGKEFQVTALGSVAAAEGQTVSLEFDGTLVLTVLLEGTYMVPVPPGLVARAGTVVTTGGGGPGADTAVWGYTVEV